MLSVNPYVLCQSLCSLSIIMLSVQDATAWRAFALTAFFFDYAVSFFSLRPFNHNGFIRAALSWKRTRKMHSPERILLVAKWLLSRLCFRDFQRSIFNKRSQKFCLKKKVRHFSFVNSMNMARFPSSRWFPIVTSASAVSHRKAPYIDL